MVNKKGTSVFENGLIWFGAAVSLAEILTGTYLAPLGLKQGLLAILVGHGIGCVLLFMAGLIGGRLRQSAMECTKVTFGRQGALLFCLLNVLQLVGWTAIMIYDGSLAANEIFAFGAHWWALIIAALIAVWIGVGIKNLGKVNTVAMTGLFLLTLVLSYTIFGGNAVLPSSPGAMSFGAAVELSAAMPLSWLPLMGDYTREAEKPLRATAMSAFIYGLVSSWMYLIGLGAALYTAQSDIALILVQAGLGVVGLGIVLLSTVTTTFLDAYSAGISSESLSSRLSGRGVALGVTALGALAAVFLPLHDITDFLYWIGSVFAPMVAIHIADIFIFHRMTPQRAFEPRALGVWLFGFILYRVILSHDFILGSTLPVMAVTMATYVLVEKCFAQRRQPS